MKIIRSKEPIMEIEANGRAGLTGRDPTRAGGLREAAGPAREPGLTRQPAGVSAPLLAALPLFGAGGVALGPSISPLLFMQRPSK